MITDIFGNRYQNILQFDRQSAEGKVGSILAQASHIFFGDLQPLFCFQDTFFREINQKLSRELGLPTLSEFSFVTGPEQGICTAFLAMPFRLFDKWHRDPDYYCKTRLSMLELLFRQTEEHARRLTSQVVGLHGQQTILIWQSALSRAIQELNVRLQPIGLVYHNGFLHLATDEQTTEQIAKPFWEIVADPKWAVVDQEMKEAFDRLDQRQHDAFTHATKALESTIKIISDENGWSTGNEKGAANYIENLQSQRSGRFIDGWEADALKDIFSKLRNPHSHGGGSTPPPRLSDIQQSWVIESCMSWIKSLVRRTPVIVRPQT
jgi:AbiJ N-terminal domain 4